MSSPTQEYFSRLDRLFQQALDLPAGDGREELLRASSGTDPDLAEAVRRLLERDQVLQQTYTSVEPPLPRFGVYQARELIGRGGMGTVYRATREDGEVKLEVAVKSISSPLWSAILDERFRRERQILAQLRHPNIAAFLDSGVSEDGLPFLVMELVHGEPVDRYCDRLRLSIRQRLELFLKVCAAVDFAHRQLIVHRDIKPSNILIASTGEPKLLDFGLARSVELSATQPENPTLYFTPSYASPELLRGRPAAVTDDVFSLGNLLYRLLVGARPIDTPEMTPAEIVEAVLNSEPRKPSAIFRGLEPSEAATVAQERGETPATLEKLAARDLDAIALKSVTRSPAERYSSVAELAADIGRYLDGRVVQAAAGGSLYAAKKFVVRHKVPVAAAALIFASVTAGIAATLIEATEARKQRAAAERRFQEARELTRYMMFELQNEIQKLPGSTPVKADMVKHSLDYLDRLAAEKSNDESLQIDVAEGYTELAGVLGHPLRPNLGQAAQARDLYSKSIKLLEPVVSHDPENERARLALDRARQMLGMSLTFYRQWERGGKLVKQAADDLMQLASVSPNNFDVIEQAASALESRAVTLSQRDGYTTGGNDEAEADLRRSVEFAGSALHMKPADPEAISQIATSYNRLALLTQTHDRPAADGYFKQALASLDSLPANERSTPAIRNRRAAVLHAMGWNLGSMGDFDHGIADMHEAAATMDQLAHEDPQNRVYPQARAAISRSLGVIEDYAGRKVEALAAYKIAISIYAQLLAANPDNPYARTSIADLEANSALLNAGLGHHAEAVQLAHAGLPVLKETAMKKDASAAELNLAARFMTEPALPEFCDAKLGLDLAKRANDAAAGKDYVVLETLAQAYWMNRDRDDAAHSIEQALSLIESPNAGKESNRSQRAYEKELEDYRTAKLPAGCPPSLPNR